MVLSWRGGWNKMFKLTTKWQKKTDMSRKKWKCFTGKQTLKKKI